MSLAGAIYLAAVDPLLEDPHVPPGDINAVRFSKHPNGPSRDFLTKHSIKHAKEQGYDHDLWREIFEAREAESNPSRGGAQRRSHPSPHGNCRNLLFNPPHSRGKSGVRAR